MSAEQLTAHDEYGLALLRLAHKPKDALKHFDAAVRLTAKGLRESDAEWAYPRWHRAAAEFGLGRKAEAEADFAAAEAGMRRAEEAIGDAKMAAYYRDLAARLLRHHATLLEKENKHEEAELLLSTAR